MTKIRCFIGLTIPSDIQTKLADIQNQLKENGAKARWIKHHNIHITLRFLGDRDAKRVKQIAQALPEIFAGISNFKIKIDSLDAFPNIKKMRTLWAGISDGKNETVKLFEMLNDGLAKLGIPKDREDFTPHFTLARCKTYEESRATARALSSIDPSTSSGSIRPAYLRSPNSVNMGLIEKAPTFSIEAFPESITFYQSTLHSEGSIYEPIAVIKLP